MKNLEHWALLSCWATAWLIGDLGSLHASLAKFTPREASQANRVCVSFQRALASFRKLPGLCKQRHNRHGQQ